MALDQITDPTANVAKRSRDEIARRAAADIPDGAHVNLGIGLPTLCANQMPEGKEIVLQSENGVLGVGPRPPEGEEDPDLINASKDPITLLPAELFMHTDAFVMIRGGHIYALLGAFEVSERGDIANWTTENPKFPPGVGGAMDLAVGARDIWADGAHDEEGAAPDRRDLFVSPDSLRCGQADLHPSSRHRRDP